MNVKSNIGGARTKWLYAMNDQYNNKQCLFFVVGILQLI